MENPGYIITMIGFLVKKTFFDLWDNMLRIVLLNLGCIASAAIPVFLPLIIPVPVLAIAVFSAGMLWAGVYLCAAAISLKAISDYGVFGFADFWANLKESWPAGIVFGIIMLFFFAIARIAIPFYLDMESMTGLLFAAIIFWPLLTALLSFQFYPAIRARLDTRPVKICKKCFIIFFDNPAFAVFSLLYIIVTLALSLILAAVLPGPAGALLFLDEALRLQLLKYDWLEANFSAETYKRQSIPWEKILAGEREKTGTRTLKNFIFPWKD